MSRYTAAILFLLSSFSWADELPVRASIPESFGQTASLSPSSVTTPIRQRETRSAGHHEHQHAHSSAIPAAAKLGQMNIAQQLVMYSPHNHNQNHNDTAELPTHKLNHNDIDSEASFYDSIVVNGDFATGDTSWWVIESPADESRWGAEVTSSASTGTPSRDTSGAGAAGLAGGRLAALNSERSQSLHEFDTSGKSSTSSSDFERTALRVTVPADSYVMMFQDVDYNSTITTSPTSSDESDENVATKANTLPFKPNDTYILTFSYRFAPPCASGSSLYYGLVNAEDTIDLEGDLDFSTTTTTASSSSSSSTGVESNNYRWRTFRRRLSASTEWGSLYLYYMTKDAGGCVFEVADVGAWRVPSAGEGGKGVMGVVGAGAGAAVY